MTAISNHTLEQLRTFDTPTVCNIIELFEVRPQTSGYMDKRIKANFPELAPMVGFASTATFRASSRPLDSANYTTSLPDQVSRFTKLDGEAIVVFQDLDSPSIAATFGEVMCSVYKAFGAQGLITSGTGRDLDQVHAIGFPVFTSGTVCSHGYPHILDVHIPIHVGGITVYPNDLLHGDVNGVTTIPHEIANDIPDVGLAFVEAEKIILSVVQSSTVCTLQEMRDAVQETDAQIDRLRQQVSRKKAT